MSNVCIPPDKDCSIDKYKPTTAYDTDILYVDLMYVASMKTQNYRTLMCLTIPAEVNVGEFYEAYLVLFNGGSYIGTTADIEICRLTQPAWTEAGATWNKYDGTNAWATAGGDYDKVGHPYKAYTITNNNWWPSWLWIDVKEMVDDAITNHSRSFDVLIKLSDALEAQSYSTQVTAKSKDQPKYVFERRPFLCIVRPPFGRPREV